MSTLTKKELTREAVATIINCLNGFGSDGEVIDAIADELNSSHRTLQQSFIKTFIDGLRQHAQNTGTDARNEAAIRYCKALDEPTFPYI